MAKTLFVIGAGASTEFNFPLGSSLANSIRSRLQGELAGGISSPRPILDGAMASGGNGDWAAAARELAAGLVNARSIDRLLDSRSDKPLVVEIGKFAIALLIAEAERSSILAPNIDQKWDLIHTGLAAAAQTWLGLLFGRLQEGVRPDKAYSMFSDFSFITFNYDRVIERYLDLSLQHVMSLSRQDAVSIRKSIKIEHVYGSLGNLDSEEEAATFGLDNQFVRFTTKSFRTFTEGVDSGRISSIRETVNSADIIIFLGFSFDPLNIQALAESEFRDGQHICATTYNMSAFEKEAVVRRLGSPKVTVNTSDHTAAQFILSDVFKSLY